MSDAPVLNVIAENDPTQFVAPARESETSVIVLGLDLGTTTGVTYGVHCRKTGKLIGPVYMGSWDLSAGNFDSGAVRFARFRKFLSELGPGVIGYEAAKVHPSELVKGPKPAIFAAVMRSLNMAELFGAFKGTLAGWAEEKNVPLQGFAVGEIKKKATGKGNANKEMMIEACVKKYGVEMDPEVTGIDNIADSSFVYLLTVEQVLPGVIGLKE